MALTDKQMRFADEYLIDLNASAAYLRAGYKCSEAAARSSSSDLLTNPNIQEYIENKQQKYTEKTEMTVEWVLQQYKDIIMGTKEIDPNVARGALDSVGKHLGMFKEKLEHSGEISIKVSLPKGYGDDADD